MTTMIMGTKAPWEQIPAQLLQQARYDDIIAILAFFVASLAYVTKGKIWSLPDPYHYKLFEKPQQRPGGEAVENRSRDISVLLDEANADVAVLWASQSGTAERYAGRLSKELNRYFGANVLLLDISDIEAGTCAKIERSKLVVFLASTFGEGDPSDNMHDFWSWLHQDQDGKQALANLRFLAFGLGNSNYKHYNHVVDVLASHLQARGAQALLEAARADDATGETEEHFLEWKEQVFDVFEKRLGYERRAPQYVATLQIVEDDSLGLANLHTGRPWDRRPAKAASSQSPAFMLPIVQSRELFKNSRDRNCLHMELDLGQHSQLKYKTGDYLDVWPINPSGEVDRLLRVLGLESKRATPCHVRSLDDTAIKVPSPTTPEALLTSCLEICAPVSREHVAALAVFAPTPAAAHLLKRISETRAAYAAHVAENYVNLGRLLQTACDTLGAWNSIPLPLIIEMLPAMRPRSYSISSSSVVQARRIAITAVVADTQLSATGTRIPGLATNHLLHAKDASSPHGTTSAPPQALERGHIHASVRKSSFKLPATASTPILMVGAGTGVAPFRAFVQERARLKTMGRDIGTTKLFFGCRHAKQDFIYHEEFASFADQLGGAFELTTAFSRPGGEEEGRKQYVQDKIAEEADAVAELLVERNAYFYVCGSAAMARDVSAAVWEVVMPRRGWDERRMKEFADRQKRQRRWVQDVWG